MAVNHKFTVRDGDEGGNVQYAVTCDDLESVVSVEMFVPDKNRYESCGSISIPVDAIEAFAAELLSIKDAAVVASTNYRKVTA